ncbi:hypothetical protein IT401_00750 [Candidatus Nomurabacteria bacterium]|nr:hypothetical protein [Candidatus Nomurabacteria bacterium]
MNQAFFSATTGQYLQDYYESIKRFFSELFECRDIPKIFSAAHNTDFIHYMIKPVEISTDRIYQVYDSILGGIPVGCSPALFRGILEKQKIIEEQGRPNESYVFAHRGEEMVDSMHRGKGYYRCKNESATYFMRFDELMLVELFWGWKWNRKFDPKGKTRTSTLVRNPSNEGMVATLKTSSNWLTGERFKLLYLCYPDCDDPMDGPREIELIV